MFEDLHVRDGTHGHIRDRQAIAVTVFAVRTGIMPKIDLLAS